MVAIESLCHFIIVVKLFSVFLFKVEIYYVVEVNALQLSDSE